MIQGLKSLIVISTLAFLSFSSLLVAKYTDAFSVSSFRWFLAVKSGVFFSDLLEHWLHLTWCSPLSIFRTSNPPSKLSRGFIRLRTLSQMFLKHYLMNTFYRAGHYLLSVSWWALHVFQWRKKNDSWNSTYPRSGRCSVSFGPVFQASITELSSTHLDLFFHSQFEPLYTFFRSRCIWFLGEVCKMTTEIERRAL